MSDSPYTAHENSSNRESPNRHEKGTKKYREWIQKENEQADQQGKLPFTLGKPPKRVQARRDIYHVCDFCRQITMVNRFRAGQTCTGCRQYVSVNETNTYKNEEELMEVLESLDDSQ